MSNSIQVGMVFLSTLWPVTLPASGNMASGQRGIVASVHPLATKAGLNVLQSGGNAIDAAVAVGLTLGVVDTHNSGIGGGCLMLVRLANGNCIAIDGREMAPSAATRDMFLRDGAADPASSQTGALASGVPGELAAFDHAVRKFGRKQLSELLLPAANIAEKGFPIDSIYALRLKSVAGDLARFSATREIFFKGDQPLQQGDVLKQIDLAATYRSISEKGTRWFYRGPFARKTERWMKDNRGILTAADFANYRIRLREPVTTTYRGFKIVSFPPPSSGGVHIAQMLNILERFDLKTFDEVTRLHVIAEAMKLAFADRAHWLGDPDFVEVPYGLVSKKYAESLSSKISLEHSTAVSSHDTPPDWERNVFGKHTAHWSVADAEGNWVACTASINTAFGSKVVIPGTGVTMNNEMDDFSARPGVPNFYGLIGAEANSIAPSKRPLSSMSPTIVLDGRGPLIAIGAAGGPRIISTVLLELVGMLDLGLNPAEAIALPRIHHQWSPNELVVEQTLPLSIRRALENRGHKIREITPSSVSQIVARRVDSKEFVGAADPRANGDAAVW